MSVSRLIRDYPITTAYGGICVVVISFVHILCCAYGWA